jgi:origin recognition complex subunit 1
VDSVVLIDEMDFILTAKQDVLYNLFDWPGKKYARLVVVGISNTLDLAERLTPRVQSRLGMERLFFIPYDPNQMYAILCARLKDLNVEVAVNDDDDDVDAVDDQKQLSKTTNATNGNANTPRTRLSPVIEASTIELIARRVGGQSGDIRRALQVARSATEICIRELKATNSKAAAAAATASTNGTTIPPPPISYRAVVTMAHAELAVQEVLSQTHLAMMRMCTKHEK